MRGYFISGTGGGTLTGSRSKSRKNINKKKELAKLRENQDRIDELMIQGAFDEETYKRKSDDIKGKMLTTQIHVSSVIRW